MEQEQCPNCGTPARPGAKFCAACGHAMAPAGHDRNALAAELPGNRAPESDPPPDAGAAEDLASWPSAPAPAPEEAFFGSGWHQQSPATPESIPDLGDATAEDDATIWRDMATNAWPAAPTAVVANPETGETSPARHASSETAADAAENGANNTASANAVVRAAALLDELRRTIGSIAQGATPDLSGVISDLEVAVTPPGAMAPDDVAELREALLAAREKPRDVDTIVDLTKRVDAMVSLVIAYDRAIAAIERSLQVLRRS